MFKSNWRNGLTLGLAIGLFAGIILVLALNWSIDPTASGPSYCNSGTDGCANYREDMPERWYWLRRFFVLEDTVAQWIMMAFTIAAAGLLLATLRTTQNMAADTREIGEAQVRAYVHLENVKVTPRTDANCLQISFELCNLGNSPAKDFNYCYFIHLNRVPLPGQDPMPNYSRENEPQYPDFPRNGDRKIKAGGRENVRHLATDFRFTTEELSLFDEGSLWVGISISTRFNDVFGKTVSDIEHFGKLGGLSMNNESDFTSVSYSQHSRIRRGN
tara:strand:- start:14366 stop:15184 length:819 start_codon:yes stop_codon:yes gene_type:complete